MRRNTKAEASDVIRVQTQIIFFTSLDWMNMRHCWLDITPLIGGFSRTEVVPNTPLVSDDELIFSTSCGAQRFCSDGCDETRFPSSQLDDMSASFFRSRSFCRTDFYKQFHAFGGGFYPKRCIQSTCVISSCIHGNDHTNLLFETQEWLTTDAINLTLEKWKHNSVHFHNNRCF